jgi:anti-repressor protein
MVDGMTELILIQDGQAVTNSRKVADKFGREHKNILRDIESIIGSSDLSREFFQESTYESRGKHYPEFIMNRDGFTLLAMGFTGADAMQWKIKYIQAFNSMEQQIKQAKQLTKLEALEMAIESEKKVLELQSTIAEQKPKVVFAESVECSKDTVLVKGLSTILNQNGVDIGQNRLFVWLRDNGYLSKRQGKTFNAPTQKSLDLKIMQEKTTTINKPDREPIVTQTPLITGKGQLYFVNKFLNKSLEVI